MVARTQDMINYMIVRVIDMVKSYGFAKLNLPSWYVRKQDQEVIALLIQKKRSNSYLVFPQEFPDQLSLGAFVVEVHGAPLDLYLGKVADPRYDTQSERIKKGHLHHITSEN